MPRRSAGSIGSLGSFVGVLVGTLAVSAAASLAQPPLRMVVNADLGRDTISRNLYGQFAEHLGRGIYDGIWARNDAGEWHIRDDVAGALRELHVPNVRWPGGCFADRYHWRDGVGLRAQRPTIVNTNWGNVTEDNSFGTHEYLDFVSRIGAAPFIVGNVGSGTVREMAEWWEYVDFGGTSPTTELRKSNGHADPWAVRYWGVGNEPWGCGGNMTPEYYANEYKRYASFLASYGKTRPFRIAAGPGGDDYHWTDVVMRDAGWAIDGLDFHYYTLANTWAHKGRATEFTEAEWFSALQRALHIEELIRRHSAIMDHYDPRKRVALVVGEWGMWHDVEPGTNPSFLYQQNTMRDALVAAASLDIFARHADRVRMANIAQMVNVLQSMILTQGDKMLLTPTYHVFEMYTVHQDAVQVPLTYDAGWYKFGNDSIPAISASASRDASGRIHISLSNLDPHQARALEADVRGARVTGVTGRILAGPAMNAHNTFEQPNVVAPAVFNGAVLSGDRLRVTLPPRSVVVLELR
jgi:alpha-N-arabinofuranosidase